MPVYQDNGLFHCDSCGYSEHDATDVAEHEHKQHGKPLPEELQ